MVGQNIKKSNANILCDVRIYLRKKNVHHNILKNVNILKKIIELISSIY
jgi:hypothetical protein